MLFRKKGFPEEGDLVICTVTKIQFHSVFVDINEYENSKGMIHISEISPGRIRNIHDFVREGKVVVCLVLRVNQEKNQIDLSLRRVHEGHRKEKINLMKQEQKAEKIVEYVASQNKIKLEELYQKIWGIACKKYGFLHECFEEISLGKTKIENLKLDKKISDQLLVVIKQRIKPPEVFLKGKIRVTLYANNGIEIIKDALIKGMSVSEAKIGYLGSGTYSLLIKAGDFKSGEKDLNNVIEAVQSKIEAKKGIFQFERIE